VKGVQGAATLTAKGANGAASKGLQAFRLGVDGATATASVGVKSLRQLDDLCCQAPDAMLEALDDTMVGKAMGREISLQTGADPADFAGMMWQHRPFFIVAQSLGVLLVWLLLAIMTPGKEGVLDSKAGLDSMWPGRTDFLVHVDCEDHRSEVWRWLTYQFTHVGLRHAGMNAALTLLLGISLEGFHGHLATMACYNVGVASGALSHAVSNCHTRLVGMSGGVYALMGMHVGELVLNWRQMRYRLVKLLVLGALTAADLANSLLLHGGSVSHATHLGGFLAGLSIAILFGRNLKVHWYERVLQAVVAVASIAAVGFAIVWLLQWAPRTIWEPTPWCWARQVADRNAFGNTEWHCVRCHSQACIERWSATGHIATVDHNACPGWAFTEM
jgi:rhomboid-related protein 1/2/3